MRFDRVWLVVALAAMGVAGPAAATDRTYETASGPQRITRHPSLMVLGLREGADLREVVGRVEQELEGEVRGASLRTPDRPNGLGRYAVSLVQIEGGGPALMDLVFQRLVDRPEVTWVEPVYTPGGGVLLIPRNLVAVNLPASFDGDAERRLHADLDAHVVWRAHGTRGTRMVWVAPRGAQGSVALANRYAAMEPVIFAEPDFLRERAPRFRPDDKYYSYEWHLHDATIASADADVEIETAWDLAYGLEGAAPDAGLPDYAGTVVGVCDTGVYVDHPDLLVISEGFDTTDSDVGINPDPGEADGHGTNVAGVSAGIGDNDIGVAGACPTCGVVGIKLQLPGVVPDSEIFYAWTDIGDSTDYNMPALNNSWGADSPGLFLPMSNTMKMAIDNYSDNAREGRGGVIVFASGNSNTIAAFDGQNQYRRTLSVGASTCKSRKATYSCYGHAVDVLAPSNGSGCGITTTSWPAGGSSYYTGDFGGTSSAAPLVSGIIGLMAEANPEITEAQIREAIVYSAELIEESVANYDDSPYFEDPDVKFSWTHAHGRVNATKAVELAIGYTDGCTFEYEVCNKIDDDCDGETDEGDACDSCELDAETSGRDICDDDLDNDCDGDVDPDDCVVPCEDLTGVCGECETTLQCWFGLECSRLYPQNTRYCLQFCSSFWPCPDGYECITSYGINLCYPLDRNCSGKEPPIPDESCPPLPVEDAGADGGEDGGVEPEPDAGEPEEDGGLDGGGSEGDAGEATEGDASVDASFEAGSSGGCGCGAVGGVRVGGGGLSSLLFLFE